MRVRLPPEEPFATRLDAAWGPRPPRHPATAPLRIHLPRRGANATQRARRGVSKYPHRTKKRNHEAGGRKRTPARKKIHIHEGRLIERAPAEGPQATLEQNRSQGADQGYRKPRYTSPLFSCAHQLISNSPCTNRNSPNHRQAAAATNKIAKS